MAGVEFAASLRFLCRNQVVSGGLNEQLAASLYQQLPYSSSFESNANPLKGFL